MFDAQSTATGPIRAGNRMHGYRASVTDSLFTTRDIPLRVVEQADTDLTIEIIINNGVYFKYCACTITSSKHITMAIIERNWGDKNKCTQIER